MATNRLSWTAASAGDAPVAGYRLYNADSDELIFDSMNPAVLTYDHQPLDPGTYRYYVIAYAEDAQVSTVSNIVVLTVEGPPEVVFIAASIGGGGGVDPTGFVTYTSPIFPSVSASPAGTRVSGSLQGYTDIGIKTFLNGVPEIVMALRVPTAELLPSPQTAYFLALDIAGITGSTLLPGDAVFSTNTSQPGFTQLLWNWGPAAFDLTHLFPGNQYTASFTLP